LSGKEQQLKEFKTPRRRYKESPPKKLEAELEGLEEQEELD
jgi:hypothetical protein